MGPSPMSRQVAARCTPSRGVGERVERLRARRQIEPADDTAPADFLSETSPMLASLVGASVQGRVALGPRAGARVRRLGEEPDLGHATSRGPRQAQLDGFDLHANVWVPPTIGPVSSGSAAISSAPRSPRTASSAGPTGASSSR
jgi:hypothetical protein